MSNEAAQANPVGGPAQVRSVERGKFGPVPAAKIEVDQSQISRLERQGGAEARVSLLKKYVEALGGEVQIVATLRGKVVRLPV